MLLHHQALARQAVSWRLCCSLSPLLSLASCFADGAGKFDEVVEDKGVKVIIDPRALMHLIGTKMDFVEDRLR